jgi:glycosyltransferase involved in cell wall biosynthesis
MKIALFDWSRGGHHALYLRRFVEVVQRRADVLVVAPDETMDQLADLSIQEVRLESARPKLPRNRPFEPQRRRILDEEVRLLAGVARDQHPDLIVHLYADAVLSHLVRRPRLPIPVAVLIFYPRAHYPTAFGTHLSPSERARAWGKERIVAAWRRRADALAVLTLDEEAARRWARRSGAPAHWIPEPPVANESIEGVPRSGCVIYGALAERKGLDLLARAIAVRPTSISITIAGEASKSFLPTLEKHVLEMRRYGATVEARPYRHSEAEGLRVLARGRCAVLPYPRHDGMSRVLLEACAVGTPVIVHDRGLLGYLVRRYELGRVVDCTDPRQLRDAIAELTRDGASESYRAALADFALRFSVERFEQAVLAALGETPAEIETPAHTSNCKASLQPGSGRR